MKKNKTSAQTFGRQSFHTDVDVTNESRALQDLYRSIYRAHNKSKSYRIP